MAGILHHIASRPWAIAPDALMNLAHFAGNGIEARASSASPFANASFRRAGSTAIVPILGTLIDRDDPLASRLGLQSYESITGQLEAAARDRRIKSIILDIDSPGGSAAGAFEAAKVVRTIAKAKPTFAMTNGLCCSAAFAIASGARAIFSTPSSMTGSIGVVMAHFDHSRALDKAGVTPTLIHAGKHKVDANEFQPLSKEVRADLEREIQKFYGMFVDTVAAGRGGRLTADAARRTEARTFIGDDAIRAGLVDDLGTMSELLEHLNSTSARR